MTSSLALFREWLLRTVCVLALAACTPPASESALRKAISDLRSAIDARDAAAIEERLAEDFIGPDGLDRHGAKRLAVGVFLRNRDVAATVGPLDLQMHGDGHASVRFTAMVSGSVGGFLPQRGQIYEVRTGWRFGDGQWQLTSAEWVPKF